MPLIDIVDHLHPTVALTTSATIYPIVFRLMTPAHASITRFVKSREALSIIHSTLAVTGALIELYRQADDWVPPDWRGLPGLPPARAHPSSSSTAIIDASPPFTNTLLAFECGYLLQDFLVLVRGASRFRGHESRALLRRNVNWRILGLHHLGLGVGLGIYHVRSLRKTAKASLIVLMMMLMNASTPLGTIHWYLTKFSPARRASICITHASYLLMYALARVYLFHWMLSVFGAWRGQSAVEALKSLPLECRLGTAVAVGANGLWLWRGVSKFMRIYLGESVRRKSSYVVSFIGLVD